MRETMIQTGKKRTGTCIVMILISLFLLLFSTKTVHAETFNCEVYYDVAKNAVEMGNAEAGTKLQLDADLCEIAKQVSVNGASGLSYYSFKDHSWVTTMIENTGNLKSAMEYTGGFKYCYGDLLTVQEDIAGSMKYIAERYPDYNLVGVSVICNFREMDYVGKFYYYTIIIGKGTCRPDMNTGTGKEALKTGGTVSVSGNASTDSESDAETKVASVKMNKTSATLLTGKKLKLTATVSPSDATEQSLTWSVSNKKYASVNQNGVVKAKAAGAGKTVTVTAKANDGSGKKATCKIKIKGAVSKITLKAKTSVKAGKKVTVEATVKVGKGGSKALKWSVSNKKYATVNAKGIVKAKKAGKGKTVTVTAKAKDGSGVKASVKIRIK